MAQFTTLKQTGWGRYPLSEGPLLRPERRAELSAILNAGLFTSYIARGLGRSYGDTALNTRGGTIAQTRLNRLLAFDPASRKTSLRCVKADTSHNLEPRSTRDLKGAVKQLMTTVSVVLHQADEMRAVFQKPLSPA